MQKNLTPQQRLDILRASDRVRKWQSLDDERVCVVCEQILAATKSISNAISAVATCSRVLPAVVPLMSRTGFIRQESIPLAHLG